MTDSTDYARLRANTGDNSTSLPDAAAEALFVQAAELYSAGSVYAGVRVLRILELLGGAYKLHDYRQNNSSESASQIFSNLTKALSIWEGKVSAAVAEEALAARGSVARFGGTTRKPARVREYPGS